MGLLTELIQRNAWEELHHFLLQGRLISELFMVDRLGRTPLFYACAKKQAPQAVVLFMLQTCVKWFASRDICGNTPLHAAAANGNAAIVKLLLQHLYYSRRLQYVNDVGSTPLLMSWKKFLDPAFTLFGHVNKVGRASPKVTENLRLLTSIHDISQLDEDYIYVSLQDVWIKTMCLVGHAAAKQNSGVVTAAAGMQRPLHDLLLVGGKRHVQCPTVAYWLAIRLFGSQHIHQRDERGNLPIHLAAQHANLYVIPMIVLDDDSAQDDNELSILDATESALTQLAKRYPKGAVTPDRQDRLPIHLAIESGKAFQDGIHALVKAAPQTLERRDVKTKLPPFLLAAASSKAPLTVTWELIRARPDLISAMTTCTLREDGKRPAARGSEETITAKKMKVS